MWLPERHRTRQTKGAGTAERAVAMVVALGRRAEKHWRRIDGLDKLKDVLEGNFKHPPLPADKS